MPIILDDIQATAPVQVFSPKFFDSKLTGSGKSNGVLNQNANPASTPANVRTNSENRDGRRRKYSSGLTTTSVIPMNIISHKAWEFMATMKAPPMANMTPIGTYAASTAGWPAGTPDIQLYMQIQVHSVVIEETKIQSAATMTGMTPNKPVSRKVTPCYQTFIYAVVDPAEDAFARVRTPGELGTDIRGKNIYGCYDPNKTHTLKNTFYTFWDCNLPAAVDNECIALANAGVPVDANLAKNCVLNFELYSGICRRSEEWQTAIHETLDMLFENISRYYCDNVYANNEAAYVLRRIEDYRVPLNLYKDIYASVALRFKPDIATTLCKQNLNLLLSDTLNSLEKNKASLTRVVPPAQPVVPSSGNATRYSPEQMKAISSSEPLILVQAGAGTGKSTTILGRIQYMIDAGIDPEDITVLSFTNAAADHIKDKNEKVHSMTIASMIHTIYTTNFKDHELSSLDTIINSLDIYYPGDTLAMQFADRCKACIKNDSDAFTRMNNFVEKHYDEIIKMLETIKQTSLELEIIICYQKIDTLTEPAEVQSKYLIIDEVQDNSIFEFIYAIKYVDKHKESLFIVGDCSQTLYEFRASNPRALNVLEGSGVFAAYQLQVNYRSNQEILDFANVLLQNIEANQYAQIQLRANSLRPVTEQSFKDAVHFKYHQMAKIKDFEDYLPTIFANDLKPYIDNAIARGEKIAFLAFTRRNVQKMQNMLTGMYPTKNIVSLVSQRAYNTTVFSEFIKRYWNQVQFIPGAAITDVIYRQIMDNLQYLSYNAMAIHDKIDDMLTEWATTTDPKIVLWQYQVSNGVITMDEMLQNVKESLLQFEIRNNTIKQAVLQSKNERMKDKKAQDEADIILSTIHSAKGLEFDHVVVIYQDKPDLDEADKRMYYVAFTRAMKSEYIVAYSTVSKPRIEIDYKTILDGLHANALAQAASAPPVMPKPAKPAISLQNAAGDTPDASKGKLSTVLRHGSESPSEAQTAISESAPSVPSRMREEGTLTLITEASAEEDKPIHEVYEPIVREEAEPADGEPPADSPISDGIDPWAMFRSMGMPGSGQTEETPDDDGE